MLRIRVQDDGEVTSFTIEGSLTARVTPELEGVWLAALEREPLKPIVVRLASVSFVDIEAKRLLTRMRLKQVKLIPTGCLMNTIVDQIEAEVAKSTSDEISLAAMSRASRGI